MTTTNKIAVAQFDISLPQHDSGSLFVGIPQALAPDLKNGTKPADLTLKVTDKATGESTIRPITWVMGSEKKGYHLCSKGTGPFPTGDVQLSIEVLRSAES